MVKWIAALVVLANLPGLASAQPALPDPSTPAGMGKALGEIINLQRAQLQATLQMAQARPATMDNTKACYMADQAFSEGTPIKAPSGDTVVCRRVYSLNFNDESWRLAWERQ